MSSTVTRNLIAQLEIRDAQGLSKYAATLDRTDLTPEDWLSHGIEEALDLAGYLQSAKREIGVLRGEITTLRADNERLHADNERLRAVLIPLAALAGEALGGSPQAVAVADPEAPEEARVHNILTDVKMLCTEAVDIPAVSGVTTSANPPTIKVILPTPCPASGNILRCAGPTSEQWAADCPKGLLVSAVGKRCPSCSAKERANRVPMPLSPHHSQRSALAAKATTKISEVFDINDTGRYAAVDEGKIFYFKEGSFILVRVVLANSYSWRVCRAIQTSDDGEPVEKWQRNGMGRWESTPIVPGAVGTKNGTKQGGGAYKVPVLG